MHAHMDTCRHNNYIYTFVHMHTYTYIQKDRLIQKHIDMHPHSCSTICTDHRHICVHICSNTKIYLCIHIHIYIHRHTYKYAHTYIYTQVYTYISTYTQTYTYICTYTNILMDTHAHLHIKIKNKNQELPQHQAFLCTCMFCVSNDHRYPEVSLGRSFLTSCQKCSSFPKPHAISFSLFFQT